MPKDDKLVATELYPNRFVVENLSRSQLRLLTTVPHGVAVTHERSHGYGDPQVATSHFIAARVS